MSDITTEMREHFTSLSELQQAALRAEVEPIVLYKASIVQSWHSNNVKIKETAIEEAAISEAFILKDDPAALEQIVAAYKKALEERRNIGAKPSSLSKREQE